MINLDFKNVSTTNAKRCPYFFEVDKNGNMLSLELTNESWNSLVEYFKNKNEKKYEYLYLGKSNRLNIYENGKINISEVDYDNENEEWVEKMKINPDKQELKDLISAINYMFMFTNRIAQYGKPIANNFNEIVEYLKKGNF